MSRKTQKTHSPTETSPAATTPTPAPDQSRRNLFIAAGATVAVVAGSGVVFFGRSSDEDDARMAQRPGLVNPQAPTVGDAAAKVQIVEFLDPACETCAVFYPLVKQVLAEHPRKIRLSLRHVPLHPGADYVVALLEASRQQDKYWPTLETLLKTQDRWVIRHVVQPQLALAVLEGSGLVWDQLALDMASAEVKQRVARDRADAALLNVKQTPEYFVNGRQMDSFGRQQLLDLIDRALRRAYP